MHQYTLVFSVSLDNKGICCWMLVYILHHSKVFFCAFNHTSRYAQQTSLACIQVEGCTCCMCAVLLFMLAIQEPVYTDSCSAAITKVSALSLSAAAGSFDQATMWRSCAAPYPGQHQALQFNT